MKNLLLFIVTTLILFGTSILSNGNLSQNALIFIGIILGITLIGLIIVSKKYPSHQLMLSLSICGFVLLLFVPCFATLSKLGEPLNTNDFTRYVLTFFIVTIILISTVILSYRHYFIVSNTQSE